MICAIFTGLLLICTAIGITGGALMYRHQRCTGVRVVLLDSAVNHFLSIADVKRLVRSEIGGCTNKYIEDINLRQIEEILSHNCSLNSHEAYFTPDGKLNIELSQKTPVLKFICADKVYYADILGNCIPVGIDWAAELPAVTGNPRMSDGKWLRQTAGSIRWLSKNEDFSERIESISSSADGKLSIRLKGREELFHLGDPVNMAAKFYRITRYEKDITSIIEEDRAYKEVNVEYKGQIICK